MAHHKILHHKSVNGCEDDIKIDPTRIANKDTNLTD